MENEIDLTTKFFMAMKMSEIMGTASAVSTCHTAIAWHDEDGTIILNFVDRCITLIDSDHDDGLLSFIREEVCDKWNFDLYMEDGKGICQCDTCKSKRSKYN